MTASELGSTGLRAWWCSGFWQRSRPCPGHLEVVEL